MKKDNITYEKPIMEVEFFLHARNVVCMSLGEQEPEPDYEDITQIF